MYGSAALPKRREGAWWTDETSPIRDGRSRPAWWPIRTWPWMRPCEFATTERVLPSPAAHHGARGT